MKSYLTLTSLYIVYQSVCMAQGEITVRFLLIPQNISLCFTVSC